MEWTRRSPWLAGLLFVALPLAADPGGDALTKEFGAADPAGPPEIAQLMFMRGEWNVTIRTRDAEGAWKDGPARPRVRGFYLEDGRTFQTTFSMGGGEVFFSTQVRAFDLEKKHWVNKFINSKRQRWNTTESRWVDGELITIVPGGYGGDEPFIAQEVVTEITADRYLMKLFRSTDDGATWDEQPMVLVFERAKR